jgi:adenylate cyclase, class 2
MNPLRKRDHIALDRRSLLYTIIVGISPHSSPSRFARRRRMGRDADNRSFAMLEIEMKFPVGDFAAIVEHMKRWQAAPLPQQDEADHYYNAPDRDFGQTDEALRLRRIGPINLITYKGRRQPGPTKTRTEIEVPLQEGDAAAADFLRILEHLGYRATAVVRKRRLAYSFRRDEFDMQACLDDVERLGTFVEVEIVAPPEQKDAAQAVLLSVVAELGLKNSEPRSYLRMVLEATQAPG